MHAQLVNLKFDDWPSDLVSFLLFWNDMMIQLEKLQSVSQQQLSCEVKKSLLIAAIQGHPMLNSIDKLDQDQVIHHLKSMSYAEYFDLLLCAAQQVDQEEDDNGLQCQLKHEVQDCECIQKECKRLSLSPSSPDMALSIFDVQHDVAKKSPPVKFSDSNVCLPHLDDVDLPHLDNVGSSISQVVSLWILLKGEQSQGEHTPHLDAHMSTSMEKSQVKHGIGSVVSMDDSQFTCKESKMWTLVKIIGVNKFILLGILDYEERLTCFPFDRGKMDCYSFSSGLPCL